MQIVWKIIRLISGLFFAVTCFVGFISLMFVNLSLSERLFPGIVGIQQSAGRGKGTAIFAFIIACPIPIVVCFLWFKAFNWIDSELKKLCCPGKETDDLAIVGSVGDDASQETSNDNKLQASLAAYAGLYGFTTLIGILITGYTYSFLEKFGKPRPQQEFFALLLAIPMLATIVYIYKRSTLMRRRSNQTGGDGLRG